MNKNQRIRLAAKIALMKNAGPLTDVSHLRYQAVFTMGAAGSGKSYVANNKWLNYLPDPSGSPRKYVDSAAWQQRTQQNITMFDRALSNLDFDKAVQDIRSKYGITIVPHQTSSGKIPFRLYDYDAQGKERLIDPADWATELPPQVYQQVQGLQDVIFSTPIHEIPSYWRQINPDLYKEELAGYMATQPGYVHEMSSEMSKSYFEAAILTGDPIVVDGVGSNLRKMKQQVQACKKNGYRVTVVWIYVPLTVNMIRNAVRTRKVKPDIVRNQFGLIRKNFEALSSIADKTEFINNKFDAMDKKNWQQHCVDINNFFLKSTGIPTLYQYMMGTKQKAEVQGPYKFVKYCGNNPILNKEKDLKDRKKRREEIVRERGLRASGSLEERPSSYSVALQFLSNMRFATTNKTAQRAFTKGINAQTQKNGESAMLYKIDRNANNSKFYEMLIEDDGGVYLLKKLWGALGKGKHRTKVDSFETLEDAKYALAVHKNSKIKKGYEDAFSSPPKGQYPIGLDRDAPGFGWGTQDIRKQIQSLKELETEIEEVHNALVHSSVDDLLDKMTNMMESLNDIDDDMAGEVRKLLLSPYNKLKKKGEIDIRLTRKYLVTLKNYIKNQLRYHK